jgi:L-serine dehydratase
MRITYDFYQRCARLPPDQLAKATGLEVHLYGSLSATGVGHGTERAALAGVIGKEPATVEPEFMDGLVSHPDQSFPVKLGDNTFDLTLKDIIYDQPKGDFPHPNTMTCKLMAGSRVLYELEYYSVGGGFIEWKGYRPPKKGQPKYPYSTMKELLAHAEQNQLSLAQAAMANEVAVAGKSEAEINAFLDTIHATMVNIVEAGLKAPSATLPGPLKLKTKAGEVYTRAKDARFEARRAMGLVAAYALAGSEENARGHLVVTAPTCGSAGVLPALVYSLGEGGRNLPQQKIRDGLMAAAAIGYLCKHNATLSGAEGGCQAEIGVASAMGAAFLSQAYDFSPQVVANAAEAALQHHLGMTCDPVAGFVQLPCIERCAFGAIKAYTAFVIATNEIPADRRVDFDTTVSAMALTAREMNAKYKETSEGGLAVSVTLC